MPNQEVELGTLIIVVLKARNLNDKHSFYKQDVFAQVTLNGTTKKTKIAIKGGQHPEWDEEIRYPVMKQSGDKSRKLEVACYAKEPRSDDLLGQGDVDITDTLRTGEFDDWVPLNIDGVVRGDLYLEMTFYSNGPAPALPSSASPQAVSSSNFQRRPSKLERIDHSPNVDPRPRASSTISLQPGRHPSGSLAPEPRRPINQSTPAQHVSVPISDRFTSAVLHDLLSDPGSSQQPPSNAYLISKSHHSRSPSPSSSERVESPLPALPREATPPAGLPSILLPGRGRPRTSSHTAPELPSTSRAKVGRVVSSPNPSQHVPAHSQGTFASGSLAQHDHNLSSRNSHLAPGPALSPTSFSSDSTAIRPPYGAPVSTASTQWRPEATSTESFSFPVPMVNAPTSGELDSQANYTYTPPSPAGYGPPPLQAAYPSQPSYLQASYPPQPTSQHWQQPSFTDRPSDPFLQARYSTPLPLPSGSVTPPRGQRSGSSIAVANPDQTRIEALRQVEKETERRMTQEEMDREMALALDRELNLEGS